MKARGDCRLGRLPGSRYPSPEKRKVRKVELMRKKSLAAMTAVIAGIVISSVSSDVRAGAPGIDKSKPVEIKLAFPAGRVRFVENMTSVEQAIHVRGQTLNQTIDSTACYRETVKGKADDTATLDLQFDRMAMKLTGPGMMFSYDSDSGTANDNGQFKPIFEPMLHKPMELKVTAGGEVKSFTGMNKIRDDVSKRIGTNMFWGQMKNAYDNDAAKIEYGESRFQFVPDHAVSVGDTWHVQRKRERPGFGNVTIAETDYTLADVKVMTHDGESRRVAIIEFKGTIKADDSAPTSKPANGLPTLKSGTRSGKIWFDLDHGQIIRSRMKGTTELAANNNTMGPMSIDVSVTNKTEVFTPAERDRQRKENLKEETSGK